MEKGNAEVFGCELALNKPYTFSGAVKSCIFTHSGCTLLISGSTISEYISDETSATSVLGLHLALESMRVAAATDSSSNSQGPRVLVLGSGRTSLVKTILNYAVRQGHAPMWVDLDLLNGSLVFPGVLGATVLDGSIISPVEEIKTTSDILTYFYGMNGPCVSDAKALYCGSGGVSTLEAPRYLKAIVDRLGSNVCARMEGDLKVNISGLICSGFPWTFAESGGSGFCQELLQLVINVFNFNILIIIGNEKLFSELEKKYLNSNIKVVKIRGSSGHIAKESAYRRALLTHRITRYFRGGGLGTMPTETSPFLSFPVIVPFKDLHIRRVGELSPQAPVSALPIGGSTRKQEDFHITRIELLGNTILASTGGPIQTIHINPSTLLHSVLALSSAPVDQEASIIDAPVVGFVIVSDVDEARGRLTLTAPSPGRLPKPFLIWSPSSSLKCAILK